MSTANGNGTHSESRRERKRRLLREQRLARHELTSIVAHEIRHLTERYYDTDQDWSMGDFWDRTRDDYKHTLPSRPGDRSKGADWPLWRTETDLDRIRQKARVVSEVNSYAKGFTENYVNHVVGKGCQYKIVSKEGTADADPSKPGKQDADALATYVSRCQDEVDRFLKRNRWNGVIDLRTTQVINGSREREIVSRTLCDGECFLRFYKVNGQLVVRFVEPEQVRSPADSSLANGWSFGIKHRIEQAEDGEPINDVETIDAFFVYWIDPSTISLLNVADFRGEEVPAEEMLHVKGPNTKSTVKRGVSFFAWDVAASFERARIVQRNTSIGVQVKAATAEIWKHATGTSAEISTFVQGQREGYTDRTTAEGNSQTENYERRYPGMVRHIPMGMEQQFPGPDNTPAYLQAVTGDLQQAVSGKCAPMYWAADSSQGTYAGLKEAGAPAVKMAEAQQTYFTAVFGRVVWRALQVAVEEKRLEDRLDLVDLQVEAPTVLQRDRLQVAQESQILNMLGALSPQTICMEAGRDYEVESANIQQHQERFGQMGTPLGMPGMDDPGAAIGGFPKPKLPGLPDTHGMGDDAGGALHEGKEELPYGRCPKCGAPGVMRERRLNGNDRCEKGHEYPSREAVHDGRDGQEARPFESLVVEDEETEEGASYDSCVRQVAAKGKVDNPHAVCKAAVGECSEGDCPCPTCQQKRGQALLEQPDLAASFPDERQDEDFSCGAAAFTAVARYFGFEPDTESEAIRALRTSIKDGTDPEQIVSLAVAHGLEAIALSCRSIDQLRQQLERGRPAIIALQAWGTPTDPAGNTDGHYIVALAVDDQYVTIMDPANFTPEEAVAEYGAPEPAVGQKVRVPLANFVERWHDTDLENVVYDRYAVVLWRASR